MQTLIRTFFCALLLSIVCSVFAQQPMPYYNSGPYTQSEMHGTTHAYSPPTAVPQQNMVAQATMNPVMQQQNSNRGGTIGGTNESKGSALSESNGTSQSFIVNPQGYYIIAPQLQSESDQFFGANRVSVTDQALSDVQQVARLNELSRLSSIVEEDYIKRNRLLADIDEKRKALDMFQKKLGTGGTNDIRSQANTDQGQYLKSLDQIISESNLDVIYPDFINEIRKLPQASHHSTANIIRSNHAKETVEVTQVRTVVDEFNIKLKKDADEANKKNESVVQAEQGIAQATGETKRVVLIEAKTITIDTSDDRTLGVEFSGGDRSGEKRFFSFSSFGLNAMKEDTGSLQFSPAKVGSISGLNGVLVNPDTADVIVRALAQNIHVKVESSPRVLVRNGQPGSVVSTLGLPYSTTITIPSGADKDQWGGYKDAGTFIEVTPTIDTENTETDDNNSKKRDTGLIGLDLKIRHTSFVSNQETSNKYLPPLHCDQINSKVYIPNKHTVIIGGLNRYGTTKEQHGVPILMHIPLVKHLASYQKDSQTRSTLFFFITATIIDPADNAGKFDKLKYVNTHIHGLNLVPME